MNSQSNRRKTRLVDRQFQLGLAGIFAYTILVSQRIAGPVYRINSVLRKMLDGDPFQDNAAEARF